MPQPWMMWRPCRSPNASIIARGGAAPPTVIVRGSSRGRAARVRVERLEDAHPDRRHAGRDRDPLALEVLEQADSGRGAGPGRPAWRPLIVHENGKHQAFAWNIGTTGRQTSSACIPRRREHRRARGARSRGASRGRPSAARSCRSCNTSPPPSLSSRSRYANADSSRVGEQLLVVDRAVGRRPVADRDDVLEAARGRRTARASGHSSLSTISTRSPPCVAM